MRENCEVKMLDYYQNLNINSGIMLQDQCMDKNNDLSCSNAGTKKHRNFNMNLIRIVKFPVEFSIQ
jgi:hypothetical protein